MVKSALAALIIAMLVTDIHLGDNGLLWNYSVEARHWSTVNYYSGNQGGYQTSAVVWTHLGFTP